MHDCVFCKIIAGKIPAASVCEDDDIIAFLDINPVQHGHTLVVPRTHYANLYETPDDVLGKLMAASKRVAKVIKDTLGADGTNIQINNDRVAGQIVPHVHVHVIPRLADDGLMLWPQAPYPAGEADRIAKKLASALGG